jgi:hypothetical protein
MKGNELRIGNWVKWDNADNFFQIESINENTGNEIEPIPLTPEILEKAGFVKWNSEINEIKIGGSYLGVYHKLGKAYLFGEYFPCQYLHQLQSLYFALTGDELNIEL